MFITFEIDMIEESALRVRYGMYQVQCNKKSELAGSQSKQLMINTCFAVCCHIVSKLMKNYVELWRIHVEN